MATVNAQIFNGTQNFPQHLLKPHTCNRVPAADASYPRRPRVYACNCVCGVGPCASVAHGDTHKHTHTHRDAPDKMHRTQCDMHIVPSCAPAAPTETHDAKAYNLHVMPLGTPTVTYCTTHTRSRVANLNARTLIVQRPNVMTLTSWCPAATSVSWHPSRQPSSASTSVSWHPSQQPSSASWHPASSPAHGPRR
jgi:hypothetical protein